LIILEQDEQDEHHAHHAHCDHFWFKRSEQSLQDSDYSMIIQSLLLHNFMCKKVLTLNSLLRFSSWKSLFLHVFSLHNQKLYLALQRFSWMYEFWVCCHAFLWTLQLLAKEMLCWQQIQSLHWVYTSRSQVQSYFLNDEVKKNKDRMQLHSWWVV